jgi:hypothetical protein
MIPSGLRLIRQYAEFCDRETDINKVPNRTRGIYALLQKRMRNKKARFDVVYIGMTDNGVKGRLKSHVDDPKKRDQWTHFSVFEVWPNITREEIAELEGLFRHIYRKDTRANKVNRQREFKKFRGVKNRLALWKKIEA